MTARRVILCIVLVPIGLFAFWVGAYFLAQGARQRPATVATELSFNSSANPGGATRFQELNGAATPRTPHTTMRTLEAFVAERVATAVNEVGGDADRVEVSGEDGTEAQVEAVRRRLRAGKDLAPLDNQLPEPEAGEAGRVMVKLAWRDSREVAVRWWPTPIRRDALRATVVGPRGSATVVAELDEKPWLEREPAVAGWPSYAVVPIEEPAVSLVEARETLRQRTINILVARLHVRAGSRAGLVRLSHQALRAQAERAMAEGAVLDQALVRVDKPYGPVWYGANLIDARPEVLDPFVTEAAQSHGMRKRTMVATAVALPGMLLVLGVVYLGLNALTRGYFRGHLRAATLAVVALAVVVVVVLVMG